MGRRRSQLGTDADREEVGRLLRQEQPGWLKERLIALRMGFSPENSMAFIAQCIGRSPATVRRVFEAFRKGGIGLVSSRQFKGGTHTLLEDGVREFLLEGLREGRWNTAVQAREQLLERFGREYSYKTVWYWLKKCAGVIRVPRPAHEQRDLGRGEAFKEGFGAILEELALDAAKPAKVWFADESRYGLLPCLRRCWTLKGLRQTKPWRTRYQWSYCYGALDVVDGESVFIQTPTVNLQWTELFLLEIKKMYLKPRARGGLGRGGLPPPRELPSENTLRRARGQAPTLQSGAQSDRKAVGLRAGLHLQQALAEHRAPRPGGRRPARGLVDRSAAGAPPGWRQLAAPFSKRFCQTHSSQI